ncbi:hypothetical protein [Streptomyces sp. MZ04]|uniref:hypothetical protein n=1 Tax=Streptomyces sp. MZ04 TaxID=2559236 RepID=UPI00107EBBFB|nr:hypothetical protein [Streptomyces sp. MZ04]TGB15122.1 hypothetical protein E2651_03605 [Streptomyces sp. MZ04]
MRRVLHIVGDAACRMARAVREAATSFGFSTLGMPPEPPTRQVRLTPDEVLWRAELEDRDRN